MLRPGGLEPAYLVVQANEGRMIHALCWWHWALTVLCYRIPLATQQAARPALSPRRASGLQAGVTRLAGAQADPATDRRLTSHPQAGLGARAFTELDFSRHRVPAPGGGGIGPLTDNTEQSSASSGPSPSLLGSDTCIRKGVMWVQQEKMFSRWKERFIILTSSYLHIFKKSTSRLSDMGTFVNKVSFRSLIECLQKLLQFR